jgi:hypothetical protein
MLTLANDMKDLIPLVAVAGGFAVAIFGIVSGTVKYTVRTKQREESRREIAAYVAEGSITPEDAQRLLEAGVPNWKKGRACC